MKESDILVVGSGPAGSTAAIYGARAGLNVTVLAGSQPSGLVMCPHIENYPGFDGSGEELLERMNEQARRFGAKFLHEDAVEVDLVDHRVNDLVGGAVIIATGTRPKMLGLPREDDLVGRGVSMCATCDAFFFKGKDVVVVGGGDTALTDADVLSRVAKSVTIVHRGHSLRSVFTPTSENVRVLLDTQVTEYLGDRSLTGVRLSSGNVLQVQGVFLAIGGIPNSEVFRDIPRDQYGHLEHEDQQTTICGVFVAGDVADPMYRQAVTAAGQGCMAALNAINYLRTR